jgi:hypothetical protein
MKRRTDRSAGNDLRYVITRPERDIAGSFGPKGRDNQERK